MANPFLYYYGHMNEVFNDMASDCEQMCIDYDNGGSHSVGAAKNDACAFIDRRIAELRELQTEIEAMSLKNFKQKHGA